MYMIPDSRQILMKTNVYCYSFQPRNLESYRILFDHKQILNNKRKKRTTEF